MLGARSAFDASHEFQKVIDDCKGVGRLGGSRYSPPRRYLRWRCAGLAISVATGGSRSWILRYQLAGRRRELGLGSYPSVTLANAREAARAARGKLAQGIDPIRGGAARSRSACG